MNVRFVAAVLFLTSCAVAQPTEQSVLGGPCLSQENRTRADLQLLQQDITQQMAEARKGNRAAAAELAKKVVRGRCSDEHWRFVLIEALAELKRFDEAIAVLEAFYDRGSNAVAGRIQAPSLRLRALIDSTEFKASALSAKLAEDRKAEALRRVKAQAALPGVKAPPTDYVAKGACPFECCRYGNWTATAAMPLYNRPGGTTITASLSKGEAVQALTGEVRLRPIPVLVRFPEDSAGRIAFLLNYTGEGYGKVWRDGKIGDGEVSSVREQCRMAEDKCWAEFVVPADSKRIGNGDWWVQIKTPAGKIGWTKQSKNFSGADGCG